MASQEKPQWKKLPKTFDSFDKLKLKPFAERLFSDMERGIEENTEEAYTISLDAGFGRGKTTFLEMFENMLKSKKEEDAGRKEKAGYDILTINAWETDFYNEPVISILVELIAYIENSNSLKSQVVRKLKYLLSELRAKKSLILIQIIRSLFYAFCEVGNQLLASKTGIDAKTVFKEAFLSQSGSQLTEDYKNRKQSIKTIRDTISSYQQKNQKRLIVLVDELDRTRPDYAIHFLEAMKHFFDIPGVCFLFAVNRQQIETTAKKLFGNDLEFAGYYDKFFRREFSLTNAYSQAVESYIEREIQYYEKIEKEKNRTFIGFSSPQKDISKWFVLFQLFNLNLRQIPVWIKKSHSAYTNYYKEVLEERTMEKNVEKNRKKILKYVEDQNHSNRLTHIVGEDQIRKSSFPYSLLKDHYDFYMVLFYTALDIKYKERFVAIGTEGTPGQCKEIFSYIQRIPDMGIDYYFIKVYIYLSLFKERDLFMPYIYKDRNRYDSITTIPGVGRLEDLEIVKSDSRFSEHIPMIFSKFVENNINAVSLYRLINNS